MQVRDGMSRVVLVVGPGHTLREAARLMAERRVGAAVVMDPDSRRPGIITERDIVRGLGERPGPGHRARRRPHVDRHRLRRARLVAGGGRGDDGPRGFRHLVVVDGGELAGVLSMRDIVRVLDRRRLELRAAGVGQRAGRRRKATAGAGCARSSPRTRRSPVSGADGSGPAGARGARGARARIQETLAATSSSTPSTATGHMSIRPSSSSTSADRDEHRLDARAREVELLADGRRGGLERAHET